MIGIELTSYSARHQWQDEQTFTATKRVFRDSE